MQDPLRCRQKTTDILTKARPHYVAYSSPYDRPPSLATWLSPAPDNRRRLLDGAYYPTVRMPPLASTPTGLVHAVYASMWGYAPPLSTHLGP